MTRNAVYSVRQVDKDSGRVVIETLEDGPNLIVGSARRRVCVESVVVTFHVGRVGVIPS